MHCHAPNLDPSNKHCTENTNQQVCTNSKAIHSTKPRIKMLQMWDLPSVSSGLLWGLQVWTKGCLEPAGEVPRGAPAGQGAGVRLPRAAAAMEAGTGAGDAAMELGLARRQNCGMPTLRQAARHGDECWRRGWGKGVISYVFRLNDIYNFVSNLDANLNMA
jgi:hypothetical protein